MTQGASGLGTVDRESPELTDGQTTIDGLSPAVLDQGDLDGAVLVGESLRVEANHHGIAALITASEAAAQRKNQGDRRNSHG